MARVIDTRADVETPSTGLMRLEDFEERKKRWTESGQSQKLPDDERTVAEIQASEDSLAASEFLAFFELEEEFNSDDPLSSIQEFSVKMEESSKEDYEVAENRRESYAEKDKEFKIEQCTEFYVNTEDPTLSEYYKEKSERIIQKILVQENDTKRFDTVIDAEPTRSSSNQRTSGNQRSFGYEETTRSADATSRTTTSTQNNSQNTEAQNKLRSSLYSSSADNMRQFAHAGPKRQKKASSHRYYGGKQKFSIKNMFRKTRDWFRNDEAKLLTKIGIAVCLEAGLLMITNKYRFEGPKEMFSYLAMMLGVFYISRELSSEGYDPRRLAIL